MSSKQSFIDVVLITFGSLLIALSYGVFIIPNELLAGGVSGLAILTNHFTGWPVGLMILLYNIPILFWARKELSRRFIIYTIIAVFLQSFFLNFMYLVEPYRNDPLLASIFGGILTGVGAGIVIRQYGSSGGVDVIAIVLRKRLGISIGTVSSIANLIVISLAAIVFGIEPAMYTVISFLVGGQAVDVVQEGLNKKRTAMIVSDKSREIKDAIMFQLHRGVTLMHGAGGFENTEKDVIFCVVNQFELARLKEIITAVDKSAFMTISETSEVLGRFTEHSFLWKKDRT
ncbi:YitT family protein [Candidatus Formimonas warabiya]|uniref:YitT family protein n=1 Tax=Formimonas warabiya TaxID=1761012 RepID=UPI0011D0CDE0|nr:YitT family protein [Candidatus Formimonas warabiya]